MTYIYDVLLNFSDTDRIFDFFEWNSSDIIDHVKEIPFIRISSKQMNDFIFDDLKVSKDFLYKIKGQTLLYKKCNNLEYAVLVSDLNKVLAVEFDSKGNILCKSSLLLDEEEDIIDECLDVPLEEIKYTIKNKNINLNFLTREELQKQKFLLLEVDNAYNELNKDKINFFYGELYRNDCLSFKEKYGKIRNDLINNFSKRHVNLYDILHLAYNSNNM